MAASGGEELKIHGYEHILHRLLHSYENVPITTVIELESLIIY